jgi:PAS domain S-box-containing protein
MARPVQQASNPARPAAGQAGESGAEGAELAGESGAQGAELAGESGAEGAELAKESGAQGAELAEVRAQLREAYETIEAIRSGDVDSLVIGPPGQEQIYALASADRPYRLIVAAMNEGAATISPRGIILDANPRLAAMTGQTGTQLAGTAVLDLVPSAHRTMFARLLDVGAGDSARGEMELSGPGGTTAPSLLAVSGFDLDGTLLRCLVLTDLTAQRRAETEVRMLNAGLEVRVALRTAELERVNKNLEAFTYSVSHDLRSPLRALSGFSAALVEDYGDRLDETGRGYAGSIMAASERMAALIDDLLLLSRVSRAGVNLEPVDLSAEAAAVAGELRSRDPGRQVRFVIADGIRVTADRSLIRTVLQNLLENAWKFTAHRDGAVIEFATTATAATTAAATAEDGMVCCCVRDNGAGFDPAYAAKLFQPFERLHDAAEFPGTGIGLASVARIIERHGGRTWAEGAVGQGATFYFTLTAADPA